MTPYYIYLDAVSVYVVDNNGRLNTPSVYVANGVRPVISLKYGTEFEKTGDGTPTNPYVVKYN